MLANRWHAQAVAERLRRPAPALCGDDGQPSGPAIDAAVLVPLINRPIPTLMFTQRAAHLSSHAGQASFPGGRREPNDSDLVDTALRETEEEVGLGRGQVQVLGRLPAYRTMTGFMVTPVVGWVEPEFELVLDPREVAGVFEIPLRVAIAPTHLTQQSAIYQGRRRHYYVVRHAGNVVWGATAGMLRSLQEVLWPLD